MNMNILLVALAGGILWCFILGMLFVITESTRRENEEKMREYTEELRESRMGEEEK